MDLTDDEVATIGIEVDAEGGTDEPLEVEERPTAQHTDNGALVVNFDRATVVIALPSEGVGIRRIAT